MKWLNSMETKPDGPAPITPWDSVESGVVEEPRKKSKLMKSVVRVPEGASLRHVTVTTSWSLTVSRQADAFTEGGAAAVADPATTAAATASAASEAPRPLRCR